VVLEEPRVGALSLSSKMLAAQAVQIVLSVRLTTDRVGRQGEAGAALKRNGWREILVVCPYSSHLLQIVLIRGLIGRLHTIRQQPGS